MKNTTFVFISCVLLSTAGYAQSDHTLGFYAGPDFSNVNIHSPNLSSQNHTGFQLGGYYRAGGFLYGQVGLEYLSLQTGLTIEDSTGGKVNLKRLQMPLYAGINLLNFSKHVVNVRVYGGPVIRYTMNAPSSNPDFSTTDFSRWGVDGTLGAGIDVLLFSLDAGYSFGLNNLFSQEFDGTANYAFVNVGMRF